MTPHFFADNMISRAALSKNCLEVSAGCLFWAKIFPVESPVQSRQNTITFRIILNAILFWSGLCAKDTSSNE
jgi:hypothetical protein